MVLMNTQTLRETRMMNQDSMSKVQYVFVDNPKVKQMKRYETKGGWIMG